MTQHVDEITAGIAGLVVAGVTFCDLDGIQDAVVLRDNKALFMPEPLEFITNLTTTRETLGYADTRYMDLEYDLNYTLFYAPAGAGRGIRDHYAGLVNIWSAIVYAIVNHDFHPVGAIKCEPQGISSFGKVADPSGAEFYGFRLTIHCMEYMRD